MLYNNKISSVNSATEIRVMGTCWLVFYDTSTLVGYLMPNPVYK